MQMAVEQSIAAYFRDSLVKIVVNSISEGNIARDLVLGLHWQVSNNEFDTVVK
jgi:hypothetical protein